MNEGLLLQMARRFANLERRLGRLEAVDPIVPTCRVYNNANISLNDSTAIVLGMNSERDDTHGQHFISAANLTGTVTKTAASAALVGAGTAFTTELSIGQVIAVPGTAVEKRVVIAIADDTHLTVNTVFNANANGQTATRVNSALVCRQAGKYPISACVAFAANATGFREAIIQLNGGIYIGRVKEQAVSVAGQATVLNVTTPGPYVLALWDFVEIFVQQTSGGALDVLTLGNYSPELGWARVG